jgi:hypothetical protein
MKARDLLQPRGAPMGLTLATLSLLCLGSEAPRAGCGPTTSFAVNGEIAKPTVFDLPRLRQFSPVQAKVKYSVTVTKSFTGALLWDVVNSPPAGPVKVDPKVNDDILGKIVIVTGCDGYRTVFGAGEIGPSYGGNRIIVAYAVDGQALGRSGFARIVAPGDQGRGRFVSNIVRIDVKDPVK